MTVNNILNMSLLKELEMIALTDHNTCRNCPALMQAAEGTGLVVVPGMELSTAEEVHMVCLFPALENAMAFDRYVYDRDYTQVPQIGVDRIMTGGNALENLAEAYPGCRFVDFAFPSADPVNDGLDWSSLKLVFQPGEFRWLLVGVVHGEWTI